MNKLNLGISGCARSGKNTFADIASKILNDKYGKTSSIFSLAFYLKRDCKNFVRDKLNFDVFTEITSEKNVIRPLFIWYGDVKRKQTNGRYWIDLLHADIKKSISDVNIITDIRYNVYERDELFWLKHELNGKLVHVSKYSLDLDMKKIYVEPKNDHEIFNNPLIKRESDYCIEWEHVTSEPAINNFKTNTIVESVIDDLMKKNYE
jgi:hypothetical protein